MEKINGSEALLRSLLEEGVDILFGYPGGAIMPIYDALYKYEEKLKHILTRHEQGAIHAAQAYARTSNRVGVCFTTSGPGATNVITGMADAMIDSTPIVCITGQVGSNLLGTDAFQETDIIGMSMAVTKWSYQITRAEEIPEVMAKAFYIAASGRPGPVLIDITKDAQFAAIDFTYQKCTKIRSYRPIPKMNVDKVKEAADLINNAQKPFVLAGQGILLSEAENIFRKVVEKANLPVAHTLLGLSALPSNHKLNTGMLGMHGHYAPNIKTNECDVLIAIGMRFDDRVTGDVNQYAKQAKVIHFDIDPSEINKIIKADVAVLGDAKETLTELYKHLDVVTHTEWLQEFAEAQKIENEKVINPNLNPKGENLLMGQVVKAISAKAKEGTILATDVGQHQMFASRYFDLTKARTLVTSGGLGTMGFGLPAAVGAKIANPDTPVVAFIGDGGFQMTMQELGTIMQENLDIKIIILNNSFLGMVRQWQELFFDKRYSFTNMHNPNFTKIAEGYGIKALKIEKSEDLEEAVDQMMSHKGAFFLEVVVEAEGNIFPMVPAGASVSDILLEPSKTN